ncbi:hypothetical protein TNCV_5083481 [Trichonephila clavipes]|nr:hypothetical protein TNCV_5083481 [Trichonephila clavipes]
MTPGVSLGCRQFDCRSFPGLLLTNTRTKTELAFIRKPNRCLLRPPMSSDLSQGSQMAMAWSQGNTRYRTPDSEVSLKVPISNSLLCHQLQLELLLQMQYESFLSVLPRERPEP